MTMEIKKVFDLQNKVKVFQAKKKQLDGELKKLEEEYGADSVKEMFDFCLADIEPTTEKFDDYETVKIKVTKKKGFSIPFEPPKRKGPPSKYSDAIIKRIVNCDWHTVESLMVRLGKTKKQIYKMKYKYRKVHPELIKGLSSQKRGKVSKASKYSLEMEEFVKNNVNSMRNPELVEAINEKFELEINTNRLSVFMAQKKIKRKLGFGRSKYTDEQISMVINKTKSDDELAKELGVSKGFMQTYRGKWIIKYLHLLKKTIEKTIEEKKPTGRVSLATPENIRLIQNIYKENPESTYEVSLKLKNRHGVIIHHNTLSNWLQQGIIKKPKQPEQKKLDPYEQAKQNRITKAKEEEAHYMKDVRESDEEKKEECTYCFDKEIKNDALPGEDLCRECKDEINERKE